MRNVSLGCAVAAAVVLAAGAPVLARGGGGGGHGGGGGGHGGGGHGGGGGGAHFGGGGGRGPMMGGGGPMMRGGGPMMGGSIRSNAIIGGGGPRFSRANLNHSARFFRHHDRFRFRRFHNTAFFFGGGYYDYGYACPIVTVRFVRGGRVFYRDVRQCDYY